MFNVSFSHTFSYLVLLTSRSLPAHPLFFLIVLYPYYSFLNSSYIILYSLSSLKLAAWRLLKIKRWPIPFIKIIIHNSLISCCPVQARISVCNPTIPCWEHRDLYYSGLYPAVTTSDPGSVLEVVCIKLLLSSQHNQKLSHYLILIKWFK